MPAFLSEVETRSFREPVARFLAAQPATTDAPESAARQLWLRMAEELELLGVAVPEELGGLGLSLAHVAIVSEELGRRLTPVPFLACAGLAGSLLRNLADADECAELLPLMIAGGSICTVALPPAGQPGWPGVSLSADGLLSGTVSFVQHGMIADHFLVPALSDQRQVLCLVRADAAGLVRVPMTTLDPSRPAAELRLEKVPARVLGSQGGRELSAALGSSLAEASVLLSAEGIGAAAECLQMCVDYLKVRRQFGHAIGSFQAVQHRAADMYAELESARAAVEIATARHGETGFEAAAAVARARSGDAFTMIARETIQLHGGIGFTWEHQAHRYFKRSLADLQLLGHPALHREQIAAYLSA